MSGGMKFMLAALVLVFLGAAGYLGHDYLSSQKDEHDLDRLAERVAVALEKQTTEDQQAGESQQQKTPQKKLVKATVELISAVVEPSGMSTAVRQPSMDANGIPLTEPEAVPLAPPARKLESNGQPQNEDGGGSASDGQGRAKRNAPKDQPQDATNHDPAGEDEGSIARTESADQPASAAENKTAGDAPNGQPQSIDGDGLASAAEDKTAGDAPNDQPQSIDGAGLVSIIEDYIASDEMFSNPAIEVLRLKIESGADDGGPRVSAQLIGEFLRETSDLAELEGNISTWLNDQGYNEPTTQILDLKVHVQMQVLEQYADLYYQNREMIGWIRIDKTQVNYPVMQTPSDPEFYLRMNFEREYAYSGLPFLDARNDPYDSKQNLIIYGHNMKSGSMFGTIPKYESKSYWKNHPRIQLDLLTEQREYEVFSTFYSREYKDDEVGFKYYDYINLDDLNSFTQFVNAAKKSSFYDTGVNPVWGDQLLTLSTCSYHTNTGKFVVVARRVS